MVSSDDPEVPRARSAPSSGARLHRRQGKRASRRYRQWVTALGGLGGIGAVISALALFFPATDQFDSRANATDGSSVGTANHNQQTNNSGRQAIVGSGILNQGDNSGNRGVIINGNVTVSGGALQQNASRNKGEQASSFKPEKYVDVRAARVAGATNVAIALHGGAGPNPAPLEEALRQALSKRGFSVIPFFREPFKREGLAEKLYNGDPELAARLMLRKHCDSVLLGVLRFGGPAEDVNGLYIREAVLDLHAIDPGTGQVVNSLQIREKGGGSTAELSTTNAMIRLEEQVEANLSEWPWI